MNSMRWTISALVCVVALAAAPYADVWDTASVSDDSNATHNELTHGSNQVHDLGVRPGPLADQDWYRVGLKRHTSFEIIVDATGGDIDAGTGLLQRVDSAGTTIQNAASISPPLNFSHSLRWANTVAGFQDNFIRVGPASCGTTCGSGAVYHIRSMETTVNVARFNNSGSQITVLMSQNSASILTVNATYFFWSPGGTLLTTLAVSQGPSTLNILNTSSLPSLVGVGGSITIAHDGPYGSLNVKAVALEPSTGFSFDTPGVYRGF